MVNRYETFDITKMAEFLKLRKKTQSATVLFLGSRAGGLFRSRFLYNTLRHFSTNFHLLSPLQQFAECFHILNRDRWSQGDVDEIIRAALNEVNVGEADAYVAQLAKRSFFNRLVTTNIDNLLEQACVSTGMKKLRDFDVFISRSDTEKRSTSYADRKSLFTIIKAFGDFAAGEYNITSRICHLEFAKNLNWLMNDLRSWNILMVGFDPIWDQHIIPALFPRSGTIWYVNEEPPFGDSPLTGYLREGNTQCIIGPKGQYEHFFHDLYNLVADSSDPHRPLSITGPSVLVDNTEQTVNLQRSLEAQAQEVRRKEPPISATPLVVTVGRLYSHLPSVLLTYYDAQKMPLIKYEIVNEMTESVNVVLTAEIKGFSDPCIDTVEIPAQSSSIYYQLPRLDRERTGTLAVTTHAFMHTRVSYIRDRVEIFYKSEVFDVYLTARNVIRWIVPNIVGGSEYLPLFEHIAAWVTPYTDAVKAMLRSAIDCHPQKVLVGYPPYPNAEVVRSQIKAIFQALKKVGKIAFVNSLFTIGSGRRDRLQVIRLPDECLREHQANCIDGAVLYASLIECASLQPVIVIQTGHAFVGWKTWRDATSYEFLETRMTLDAPFEQAYAKGMENYRYLQENEWFLHEPFDPRGFARLLDIKELRDLGLFPME